mmetsp:Transcript_5707/g.14256  ORF Transcript_5707/g.14256 Transcript_5707/m.14256 type:complete len:83 (-) Transcript_5707:174-422(-)
MGATTANKDTRNRFGARRRSDFVDDDFVAIEVDVQIRIRAAEALVFGRSTGEHQVVGSAEVAGRVQEFGVGERATARRAPTG